MYNLKIILICYSWYLLFLFDFATSLDSKSTGSLPDTTVVRTLKDDTSHEEVHSKNGPSFSVIEQKATLNTTDEPKKKIKINTKKVPVSKIPEKHESVENLGNIVGGSIATEGGTFNLSKISIDNNLHQNITKKEHNQKLDINNHLTKKLSISPTVSILPQNNVDSEKPKHKRIHARPGVKFEPEPIPPIFNISTSSTTTEATKKQKKPLFTMIDNKEIDTSESFIESPTTGRDYVLPIVLIILALPVIGYIIKVIYRRGTEFTERQQYHRMYLIDGMYNSR